MTGSLDDPNWVPADERVFLRDLKPHAIVNDLDQLSGPVGGVIELSHAVSSAPGGPSVAL